MSDDGSELFSLFIYVIPQGTTTAPNSENILEWLEGHCSPAGDAISFKRGDCFRFFHLLYEFLHLDLLQLVGASIMEGSRDDDYCAGVLQGETLNVAVSLLASAISENRKAAGEFATAKNVDGIWFLRTIQELHELLAKAAAEEGAIGYFE
jgi:hypothetical protein